MLYVKARISDNTEIKVDLYEDEIFSTCPECGKEVQVEPVVVASIINSEDGFSGTSIYCDDCAHKKIY